jgi:hypothetical protein
VADSLDGTSHVSVPVTISSTSVTGLSPGTISYDQRAIGALNVNIAYDSGVATNNVVDVLSTPNVSGVFPGLSVTDLTTGGGDQVFVGQNGSVQGINGTLFVSNDALAQTFVTIDDSKDPTAQTQVTFERYTDPNTNLLYQAAENLAPANIYLADDEVQSATVLLGTPTSGHNVATVADTIPDGADPYLTLVGGSAGDTALVQGASSNVVVDRFGAVTVGNNGLLTGVNGNVTIRRTTTITVDDSTDPTSHAATAPVTITAGSIAGLSQGTIFYDQSALNTLNIDVAYDSGARTSSVFHVLSAPNFDHTPGPGGVVPGV